MGIKQTRWLVRGLAVVAGALLTMLGGISAFMAYFTRQSLTYETACGGGEFDAFGDPLQYILITAVTVAAGVLLNYLGFGWRREGKDHSDVR